MRPQRDFARAAMQLSMFGEVGLKPQPDCKRKRVGRSFKLPTLSHESPHLTFHGLRTVESACCKISIAWSISSGVTVKGGRKRRM